MLGEASLEALERSVGGSVECGAARITVEARPAVRELLRSLEEVENGGLLVARLPTGYGKSISTLFMAAGVARVGEELGVLRVIHVLPMRSILENVYRRARCAAGLVGLREDDIAYQAGVFLEAGLKDELFQARLVYTTLDSYTLNYAKVTPLRTRYASYEAARAAIYTSLTVFDEAHLFMEVDADRAFTALATMIASLLEARLPVVLLTATLPTPMLNRLLNELPSQAPCLLVDLEGSRQSVPSRCRRITVHDDAWREPSIETRVVEARGGELPENLVSEIVDAVEAGRKVAVVRNTVRLAIGTFEALRRILPEERLVLLHGRMTRRDRMRAEERLDALDAGVVVATQVIEAGVDIDVDMLVSDAAPLAQLAQRAGRVCRGAARGESECRGRLLLLDGGDEYYRLFRSVYSEELTRESMMGVRELLSRGGVAWRDPRRGNSYAVLLDRVYGRYTPSIDEDVRSVLQRLDALIVLTRAEAQEALKEFCSFVRDDARLPVLVYSGSLDGVSPEVLYDHVLELPLSYLNAKTGSEEPRYRSILLIEEREGEEYVTVVYTARSGRGVEVGRLPIPLRLLVQEDSLDCRRVSELDRRVAARLAARRRIDGGEEDTRYSGLVGVVARSGVYEEGVGLVTDRG